MALALDVPAVAAFLLALLDRAAGRPGCPAGGSIVGWMAATPAAWWAVAHAGRRAARSGMPDAGRGGGPTAN